MYAHVCQYHMLMTDVLAVDAWEAHRFPEPIDDSLPLPGNTLHTTVTSDTNHSNKSQPVYGVPLSL